MNIRIATESDGNDIGKVHLAAFDKSERKIVAKLATDLLLEQTTPSIFSLVAEIEGAVIGHVAFSPVIAEKYENFQGYILAPLGVMPEYQKNGFGSKLIEEGIRPLAKSDVHSLFVYGDPEYYGRFGFNVQAAKQFIPPFNLQYPFGWQVLNLKDIDHEGSPIHISCVTPLNDPALW